MWREYSLGYLKHNRMSGLSILISSFVSALLLSLLCSVFYNLWSYDIARVKAEEGDWQGRIEGALRAEDIEAVRQYGNVENIVVNEELSQGSRTVADIYFKNMRTILDDMPRIAEMAGLSPESVAYHDTLLNLYLIRDPADPAPRLVFPFFLVTLALACVSLILIIHNAFVVTMHARIHQFGIFSTIGATPAQIRMCLVQEAAALCAVPVVAGNLFGILIAMGIVEGVNKLLADVQGRLQLPFAYHPLILLGSLLAAALTVWISAWIPARKMSRLTPLEAVKNTKEIEWSDKHLRKIHLRNKLMAHFFGIEGELAANALRVQRKSLRTASWSLTLSFLAFSLMMSFLTLTQISQRMTYFEKYQEAWDVMVTVQNEEIEAMGAISGVRQISGVNSAVLYQKAKAKRIVRPDEISAQANAIKMFEHAPKQYVSAEEGGWLVNAPIVILDDGSFLAYCGQIGAKGRLDGAVILNQTRDVANPNFRERDALPYLKENGKTTVLQQEGDAGQTAELAVIAYTMEPPVLREEYGTLDSYEIVHILPVSAWRTVKGKIKGQEDDAYLRILADRGAALGELETIEKEVLRLYGSRYETEMENRIQDKIDNDAMYDGMRMILGGFCALLALIGIGNVCSNTLGFVYQRKREFARYMSVGLTPLEMVKIFCAEALVIAGRPVLVTMPLVVASVGAMLKLSYLEPEVFIQEAPALPIFIFLLLILLSVAAAYGLGAKKMLQSSLSDALRDDTMM